MHEWFETYFKTIDTKKLVKDAFLDGYETLEDYEKYGEAFIRAEKPKSSVIAKVDVKKP